MLLLGIETSCDDTATAVVRDGEYVLSNVATHQDSFHAKYGGIVPDIAAASTSRCFGGRRRCVVASPEVVRCYRRHRGHARPEPIGSHVSRRRSGKSARICTTQNRSMPSTTSTVTSSPRSSIVRRSRPFHFSPCSSRAAILSSSPSSRRCGGACLGERTTTQPANLPQDRTLLGLKYPVARENPSPRQQRVIEDEDRFPRDQRLHGSLDLSFSEKLYKTSVR